MTGSTCSAIIFQEVEGTIVAGIYLLPKGAPFQVNYHTNIHVGMLQTGPIFSSTYVHTHMCIYVIYIYAAIFVHMRSSGAGPSNPKRRRNENPSARQLFNNFLKSAAPSDPM